MSRIPAVRVLLRTIIPGAALVAALLAVPGSGANAAQDRYTLKAPNGVSFSEFKGYETWQDVAVSQVPDGIKLIAANKAMIDAYRSGVPGNGKAFPEGSMVVKIQWSQKKNTESPYPVTIPDKLMSVSFIQKDSKRFKDTSGWGYAQFLYDAPSGTFKAFGKDASFNKEVCYSCHTAVKAKDYIFTAYPKR
jgi:hypothetical protein